MVKIKHNKTQCDYLMKHNFTMCPKQKQKQKIKTIVLVYISSFFLALPRYPRYPRYPSFPSFHLSRLPHYLFAFY